MNTPLLDESTSDIGDNVIHKAGKTESNHLGYNIHDGMDKANVPIVGDVLNPSFTGKRREIR
jgi:hypothetical protein